MLAHPSNKNKDVLPGPEGSPAPRWGTDLIREDGAPISSIGIGDRHYGFGWVAIH